MNSIFDPSIRAALIQRIQLLDMHCKPDWGKMNVYQMVKHGRLCEEMYLGKSIYKRTFPGRLFGRMALKNLMKDEKPLGRNAPTSPYFKVNESTGDLEAEKQKWITLMHEYGQYSPEVFQHWFFGTMTKEQVGFFVYKHADHHLRQFNR